MSSKKESAINELKAQAGHIENIACAFMSIAHRYKQELGDVEWQMVGIVSNIEESLNLITEIIDQLEEDV